MINNIGSTFSKLYQLVANKNNFSGLVLNSQYL